MAITILNQPQPINPTYNDTYISFSSDLVGNNQAKIKIQGFEFSIIPNLQGVYHFNLKEIVKGLFESSFQDGDFLPSIGYKISDLTLFKTFDFEVSVYNDEGDEENIQVEYSFNKSVKQFGEDVFQNDVQLLNHTLNGYDYNLTYFEGYPFDITVQNLNDNSGDLTFKNKNSNQVSEAISIDNGTTRIYLDKGVDNWSITGFLNIPDLLNKLELYVDDSFKVNLNLKKVTSKCGVYLKWFNKDGSYSYRLFDEFFKDETSANSLDEVGVNSFQNINSNSTGNLKILGKEGARELQLKTRVNQTEVYQIKDIITSPQVQMYSSNKPFTGGKWLNVTVSTRGINISNKKASNEVAITVVLPQLNTQTL
ncbi:hypothetical protein [Leeuwenhoekiella sp. NPDC079379]|uniref:hypothetical protein n=1 Tax=Leeuwenhoekiella sp. NPDC079379 TaxID=3364122 RepID=UPI0037CCC304